MDFKKPRHREVEKTDKNTFAYDKSGLTRTLDTEINAPGNIELDFCNNISATSFCILTGYLFLSRSFHVPKI